VSIVISLALSTALLAPYAPASPAFNVAAPQRAVASVKPKVYANCKDLNKVYKHGAGLKGAKDKHSKSSKAVTNFTIISKAFYDANKLRDGDKDKILCEKR
jgi:hypothetical protein